MYEQKSNCGEALHCFGGGCAPLMNPKLRLQTVPAFGGLTYHPPWGGPSPFSSARPWPFASSACDAFPGTQGVRFRDAVFSHPGRGQTWTCADFGWLNICSSPTQTAAMLLPSLKQMLKQDLNVWHLEHFNADQRKFRGRNFRVTDF